MTIISKFSEKYNTTGFPFTSNPLLPINTEIHANQSSKEKIKNKDIYSFEFFQLRLCYTEIWQKLCENARFLDKRIIKKLNSKKSLTNEMIDEASRGAVNTLEKFFINCLPEEAAEVAGVYSSLPDLRVRISGRDFKCLYPKSVAAKGTSIREEQDSELAQSKKKTGYTHHNKLRDFVLSKLRIHFRDINAKILKNTTYESLDFIKYLKSRYGTDYLKHQRSDKNLKDFRLKKFVDLMPLDACKQAGIFDEKFGTITLYGKAFLLDGTNVSLKSTHADQTHEATVDASNDAGGGPSKSKKISILTKKFNDDWKSISNNILSDHPGYSNWLKNKFGNSYLNYIRNNECLRSYRLFIFAANLPDNACDNIKLFQNVNRISFFSRNFFLSDESNFDTSSSDEEVSLSSLSAN